MKNPKRLTLLLAMLLAATTITFAQHSIRTEEYAILELNSQCKKSSLSITNNAHGTTVLEAYDDLTDEERILLAMNDLNAKGFKLKSATETRQKCRSKRSFLFSKSRADRGDKSRLSDLD